MQALSCIRTTIDRECSSGTLLGLCACEKVTVFAISSTIPYRTKRGDCLEDFAEVMLLAIIPADDFGGDLIAGC